MTTSAADFVDSLGMDGHEWEPTGGHTAPFKAAHYGYGAGDHGFEVLAVEVTKQPGDGQVRELWKARQMNQAVPLVVVVLPAPSQSDALVAGPAEADLSVRAMPLKQITSLLQEALSQKTSQAASRALREHLVTAGDSPFAGLVNQGLFADHAL
ncbi:MAG: hypothetical protein WCJ63_09370, partial [Actinomycetes bacterium]